MFKKKSVIMAFSLIQRLFQHLFCKVDSKILPSKQNILQRVTYSTPLLFAISGFIHLSNLLILGGLGGSSGFCNDNDDDYDYDSVWLGLIRPKTSIMRVFSLYLRVGPAALYCWINQG